MSLRTQLKKLGEELGLTGPDLLAYIKEAMAEEKETEGGKDGKKREKKRERKGGKGEREWPQYLTQKATPDKILWMGECESAIKTFKVARTLSLVLHFPDITLPFIVHTDASRVGITAVLLQECPDSEINSVLLMHTSHTFSDAETCYYTSEITCLAIVWAIKKFQPYLYGCEFILQTDHQLLIYLSRPKQSNAHIMYWSLLMTSCVGHS